MIRIVNMIPASLSGEFSQDSEPNIAVNPANPTDIVGTAFTRAMGGSFAPIYVSTNGGLSWSLRNVVPGNGSVGTGDITVGFATSGGVLYAGTLNGSTGHLQILRTAGFTSTTAMTVLVDRANEDQPWVVAGSVVAGGVSRDHVFVGNNDFNQPNGRTATVDLSADAATAPAPAGFVARGIERRATSGQDGPPIRIALHPSGVVYGALHRWQTANGSNVTMDVVVTRDDGWGTGAAPFSALVDSGDGLIGQRVATGRFIRFNDTMGQERLGADLAIAVDPSNAGTVYLAWCDRVGGSAGTDWTIHVRRSTNSGQSWSGDIRTITNAKNPALAVNADGEVGFLCQQFTGTRWVTQLELTADAWASPAATVVLHTAPSTVPARTFLPYIGDYVRLIAVDSDFYGVFCGNNTPDQANFPSGVTYQRFANWATHTLLNTDNTTPVATSIDPFFFHWTNPTSPTDQGGDIALVRQTPGWGSIPIAFANGDGSWNITNGAAPTFIEEWANQPGVRLVPGDFNGNGLTDIALVRQTPGWGSIPIAFANGDGSWNITNGAAPTFIEEWANQPGVRLVPGDFNGNGLTDIALVRQTPGWGSIPIAFANGDGSWNITNGAAPTFIEEWANQPGVRLVPGDFNGNGLTDIALVRQTPGWGSIPIAFANGDGSWNITNGAAPTFIEEWANQPGVRLVPGDFNGNGLTDIALVRQTPGWGSIPIAFANGDGSWNITNGAAPTFIEEWANQPGVRLVPGDFNGNGLTDIALVRQTPGWGSIPIAFANGDGSWNITNGAAPTFIEEWANQPGVRLVPGDFNGNGLTDIALVRQTPGWGSIPIAFANGDGSWNITNGAAPTFIEEWANQPGVRLITGKFH